PAGFRRRRRASPGRRCPARGSWSCRAPACWPNSPTPTNWRASSPAASVPRGARAAVRGRTMPARVAAGGGALIASAAAAQDPAVDGFTQRFISPCGQPWRAGPDDAYPLFAWFKATDANADGAIDRDEFRADHARFFDALDRDRNGLLDPTEI